jgi:ABC-2 type transport system permease protein
MPIMQLFLLGYAATTDVKNISMTVSGIKTNQPNPVPLLDAFRVAIISALIIMSVQPMNITALIESGKIRAVLVIPPDYDAVSWMARLKSLVLDGSDASVGGTALSTAKLIGQSYATKVLTEQAALTAVLLPLPRLSKSARRFGTTPI